MDAHDADKTRRLGGYAADAGIFAGELETVPIDGTDHYALIATLEVR